MLNAIADAALSAMREPTPRMVNAFFQEHPSPYELDTEDETAAALCYRAMIDAAIQDKGE